MRCQVCGTEDEKLIRTCQLSGVIPGCLGTLFDWVVTKLRPEDEKVMEDGE